MIDRLRRAAFSGSSIALVLVVLGLLYAGSSAYRQELAILALTYAFLAVGMYLPLALTGQLSLAYNAYFAIGAYAVVIWSNETTSASLYAVPVAVAISMAAALALGLATVRLTGFHLAVSTLLFGIAVRQWILSEDELTGGVLGLGGVRPPELFGWAPDRDAMVVVGALALWTICVAVGRVRRTSVGVALRAQQDAPAAAAAAGFPARVSSLLTLAVGAGVATLGGCFFAYLNGFVLPDSFTVSVAFLVLFMPVLGGLRTPWGAFLGAVLVICFTEAFTFLKGPGALTFGALTLVALALAPAGLLGLLAAGSDRIGDRLRRRGGADPAPRDRDESDERKAVSA
ncbi:branched-chain amino acid ABC transporter permease [Nocardioides sp. LHD-245]|uniref:branched-chain amino acid ABC transporter permease n=1 Tax=Nocardioides sp. LHD-245 TaxID=3051387 RepID=UPI0027E1890C|nr:branched-chain amino acid ABC transporter permease [Nocardioides sp. LHD-245]